MVDTIKAAFGSKKFLATVIGAVVVAAGSAMGLSEEQRMKIAAMIVAYVVGQGGKLAVNAPEVLTKDIVAVTRYLGFTFYRS